MKSKERLTGKPFEDLIFNIYKELEPHATIKKNDRIKGIESGIEREIDISLKRDFGGHEILMIIQAKDHKKKADIKILGEFDSVIRDVRASRGILICNAGFTKTAKEYAKNRAIDLCSAHDAASKEWAGEIKIPVIRKQTIVTYGLIFPFRVTKEYKDKTKGVAGIQFKSGPNGIILKGLDGREIEFIELFINLWTSNRINMKPGEYKITLDAYGDIFDHNYTETPQLVELKYSVKTRHYLKFLTPVDYRGIKSYITEKFKPSFVKIDITDSIPFYDDKSWQYIEDPQKIPLDMARFEIDVIHIDNAKMVRGMWQE
ncbi:MAG: restriction endonuclease [Bacteroidetes bacterium]|nr:restriction endonuclease [Bacteroidota bacterium]